jgi:AbrB family looped-hinge helix DNA binding protein
MITVRRKTMIVKITSKRQVTFPAHVLEAMGVGPGDRLEITEGPDGFILRPSRIDHSRLAPLRHLIPPDAPPFDIRKFRDGTYDPALRD